MDIFNSVEFYVIIITVAILLFSFIVRPSKKGEAQTYFFSGEYINTGHEISGQQLIIECHDNGEITFTHTNIDTPDNTGINIVVNVIDTDIKITEKIYDSNRDSVPSGNTGIYFTADCFKPLRYHIFYEAPYSGQWASCNFTNKEGNRIILDMKL